MVRSVWRLRVGGAGVVLALLGAGCAAPPQATTASQAAAATASRTASSRPSAAEPPGNVSSAATQAAGAVDLASIQMATGTYGWGIGTNGAIWRTQDGGASWTDVTPPGQGGFAPRQIALVAAGPGRAAAAMLSPKFALVWIETTTNGGATWTEQPTIGLPKSVTWAKVFLDFAWPSAGRVLVTGEPALGQMATALFSTRDGGKHWTQVGAQTLPQGGMYETGLAFAGAAGTVPGLFSGWITGTYHADFTPLYVSTDGGSAWRRQSLPLPRGATYLNTYPPRFFGQDGILPTIAHFAAGGPQLVIYRTGTSGKTWLAGAGVPVDAAAPLTAFTTAQDGLALAGAQVYRTTDGGRGWTRVGSDARLAGAGQLDAVGASTWALVGGRVLKTTDGGRIWAAQPGALRPIPRSGLHMITARIGWAQGQNGAVLRTTDGGRAWVDVTPPGADLQGGGPAGFDALDGRHAWLAYAPPSNETTTLATIYRTSDGGASWTRATISGAHNWGSVSLDFPTAGTGYLLALGGAAMGSQGLVLFRTADGGRTWTTVSSQRLTGPTNLCRACGGDKTGMTFADAQNGYLGTTWPTAALNYYATHDGGKSWSDETLPPPPGYPSAVNDSGTVTDPPVFFGPMNGVLAFPFDVGATAVVVFYETSDGGRTWTPTTGVDFTPNRQSHGIWSFADALHGFVVNGSQLERTSDGGRTWAAVQPNVNLNDTSDLDFLSPTRGWAITAGQLLQTTDGGHTWADATAPLAPGA